MKLDRHEKHVLRELRERYNLPTYKVCNLVDQHKFTISYSYSGNIVVCMLLDDRNPSLDVYGFARRSPKDKSVERIGRMVAFGRAVVNFLGGKEITGDELEDIARGANGNGGNNDLLRTAVRKIAERYAPVYKTLDWTWSHGVPDADRIEDQIWGLIVELEKRTSAFRGKISTGGFVVSYDDFGQIVVEFCEKFSMCPDSLPYQLVEGGV